VKLAVRIFNEQAKAHKGFAQATSGPCIRLEAQIGHEKAPCIVPRLQGAFLLPASQTLSASQPVLELRPISHDSAFFPANTSGAEAYGSWKSVLANKFVDLRFRIRARTLAPLSELIVFPLPFPCATSTDFTCADIDGARHGVQAHGRELSEVSNF
jgi:hypothetical protein